MVHQRLRRNVRVTAGLLAAAACWLVPNAVRAQSAEQGIPAITIPDRPDNANTPRDPVRLVGNIYWVGHSQVGAFLIRTPAGAILIDSTSAEYWPGVRANIEALGLSLRDVKVMLNLHTHDEHMGGFARMKALTGATVILSQAAAEEVATGGRTDFREDGRQQYEPFTADRVIRDGETVSLGGTTLTAHLTPGHTTGCTTYTTTVEEDGRRVPVVFMCGFATPGIDRSWLLDNPKYPDVARDYQRSFARIRSLPCEAWFYPRATTILLNEKLAARAAGAARNPFIDPEGCQWYIDQYEHEFADQLSQQLRNRAARRDQARRRPPQ